MDVLEQVRKLIALMVENDLAEIEVEQPDLRIKIRKLQPPAPQYFAAPIAFDPSQQMAGYQPALGGPPADASRQVEAQDRDGDLTEITSPMVGTFYRAASHGADPYVSIGSEVDGEAVVCIIEAMKVMNEIRAEAEGKIAEILVQDGEAVEFGQVLFLVEPSE